MSQPQTVLKIEQHLDSAELQLKVTKVLSSKGLQAEIPA